MIEFIVCLAVYENEANNIKCHAKISPDLNSCTYIIVENERLSFGVKVFAKCSRLMWAASHLPEYATDWNTGDTKHCISFFFHLLWD